MLSCHTLVVHVQLMDAEYEQQNGPPASRNQYTQPLPLPRPWGEQPQMPASRQDPQQWWQVSILKAAASLCDTSLEH